MKKICILGSTGSIGTQSLDILERHGGYEIYALAAKSSVEELERQVRRYKPVRVCVYDEAAYVNFKQNISDMQVEVLTGMEGLIELASDPACDLVETALVGMIGIRPTIAAIEAGHDVALANKETLVTAGHIIMPLVAKKGVRLLPIDSEHSAILQCLQGKNGLEGLYGTDGENVVYPGTGYIDKILLTASGGPFRGLTTRELETKTAAEALRHPNWLMGKKITIDSASLVNKALEVMEARWLFGVSPDRIQVVIQPRSIIHSAVQFTDGAILAQIGCPDMRLPIQYALYYPERPECPVAKLDLFDIAHIDFDRPDYETFRGLKLGLEAISEGGSICTVFNAANEFAVAEFLEDRIGFTQIYDIIEVCMKRHTNIPNPTLEEILWAEADTRAYAAGEVK